MFPFLSGLHIGKYTIIDEPITFGERVCIGNYVHIRPNVILGDECDIRDYSFIAEGAKLGKNVRCGVYVNIGAWMEIADDVYIGSKTIFTNDKTIPWPDQSEMTIESVKIEKNVRIGVGCIILPGVTLAEGCVIGAGAVVTKSTKPYHKYMGVPAREKETINATTV